MFHQNQSADEHQVYLNDDGQMTYNNQPLYVMNNQLVYLVNDNPVRLEKPYLMDTKNKQSLYFENGNWVRPCYGTLKNNKRVTIDNITSSEQSTTEKYNFIMLGNKLNDLLLHMKITGIAFSNLGIANIQRQENVLPWRDILLDVDKSVSDIIRDQWNCLNISNNYIVSFNNFNDVQKYQVFLKEYTENKKNIFSFLYQFGSDSNKVINTPLAASEIKYNANEFKSPFISNGDSFEVFEKTARKKQQVEWKEELNHKTQTNELTNPPVINHFTNKTNKELFLPHTNTPTCTLFNRASVRSQKEPIHPPGYPGKRLYSRQNSSNLVPENNLSIFQADPSTESIRPSFKHPLHEKNPENRFTKKNG